MEGGKTPSGEVVLAEAMRRCQPYKGLGKGHSREKEQ